MTNFEKIKSMSLEEMKQMLCDMCQSDCEQCPATDHCYKGHNGMLDWLKEEAE